MQSDIVGPNDDYGHYVRYPYTMVAAQESWTFDYMTVNRPLQHSNQIGLEYGDGSLCGDRRSPTEQGSE